MFNTKNAQILMINFQCSLILEYCAKGNLRSFLIDHRQEFEKSLEYYEKNNFLELLLSFQTSGVSHDVSLLYRWLYQVIFILFSSVIEYQLNTGKNPLIVN